MPLAAVMDKLFTPSESELSHLENGHLHIYLKQLMESLQFT